jgi:DivIVA domain-containing protein
VRCDPEMNAEDVYRIQFSSPPAGNHGYRMDEVDSLLDVVAARLKMRNHLTAEEVRGIAFRRAPVDRGYDTQEVDHFLDEVEAMLAGNRRSTGRQWRIAVPDTPRFDQRPLRLRRGNRNRVRFTCQPGRAARSRRDDAV